MWVPVVTVQLINTINYVSIMNIHTFKNKGPGLLSRYSDSLQAGRSGDRIPAGARFSAPVQTVPGAHPASYTNGYRVFPGGKAAGAWR